MARWFDADLQTKSFARFARSEGITDASLIDAVERAERGFVDAALGGGLVKQRVARQGQGRRGGYRTIIAFRAGDLAVFLFGFAKRDVGNIAPDDLEDLQRIASPWLASKEAIAKDVKTGLLMEIAK